MKRIVLLFLMIISFTFSKDVKKIGVVFSSGGLGTGFNKQAYDGLMRAKKEGLIDFKYVEPTNPAEDLEYTQNFAEAKEYDLILGMGSVVAQSIKQVQKEFPEQKFAIIGATLDLPNTVTIDYAEHEVSFLAGVVAGMTTKTKKVGTLLGLDNKSFNRFKNGFEQGAKYMDSKIEVRHSYMPSTSANPFNDPVKAKNISNLLIDSGLDVIMQVAEGSGQGVFEAVKEKNVYAIGSDIDEDGKIPGRILTSVRIRNDEMAYKIAKELSTDELEYKYTRGTFKNGGISLTDFKYTKDEIGKKNLEKLAKIKEEIIRGKIKVKE